MRRAYDAGTSYEGHCTVGVECSLHGFIETNMAEIDDLTEHSALRRIVDSNYPSSLRFINILISHWNELDLRVLAFQPLYPFFSAGPASVFL